jgi:hypothetical protein
MKPDASDRAIILTPTMGIVAGSGFLSSPGTLGEVGRGFANVGIPAA